MSPYHWVFLSRATGLFKESVVVIAQGLMSSHKASPNISDGFFAGCKLKVQKGGKKSADRARSATKNR
jgi:hypothetical protein